MKLKIAVISVGLLLAGLAMQESVCIYRAINRIYLFFAYKTDYERAVALLRTGHRDAYYEAEDYAEAAAKSSPSPNTLWLRARVYENIFGAGTKACQAAEEFCAAYPQDSSGNWLLSVALDGLVFEKNRPEYAPEGPLDWLIKPRLSLPLYPSRDSLLLALELANRAVVVFPADFVARGERLDICRQLGRADLAMQYQMEDQATHSMLRVVPAGYYGSPDNPIPMRELLFKQQEWPDSFRWRKVGPASGHSPISSTAISK